MSEMPPNGNGRIDIPGGENFVDIRAIFEDGAKGKAQCNYGVSKGRRETVNCLSRD